MSNSSAVGNSGSAKRQFRFFVVAAALTTGIIFLGFLPSFFLRSQYRDTPLPGYLLVHGTLMAAWTLLFVTQTALIARGRIAQHKWLGRIGALLAIGVVVAGVNVTLKLPSVYAPMAGKLPFPLEPMVVGNLLGFAAFGGLVTAAVGLRHRPAAHKRLIYWSCIVTTGPALTPGRTLGAKILPYFPATFPPEIALVWIAWIALLIHDWRTRQAFHLVTVIGGILLLFALPAVLDWTMLSESVNAWVRSLS